MHIQQWRDVAIALQFEVLDTSPTGFSAPVPVFHMRCVGSILGVSRSQCWKDHISEVQLLKLWGDLEPLNIKVANRRLEWLGHVVRIE